MAREERPVVEEGHLVGVLVDHGGGQIAADDPAERAVTGAMSTLGLPDAIARRVVHTRSMCAESAEVKRVPARFR